MALRGSQRSILGSLSRSASTHSLPKSAIVARLPYQTPSSAASRSLATSSKSAPEDEQSADDFESLYSARYRGQGAKKDLPPWYKSPTLLLLGFMPLFTFGLGWWQVQRLDWKLGLIEELEYKLKKEPIKLPKNVNLDVLPSFEFRLVSLSGYLDHSRTMFLGPRVRDGVMGYNVVVPLMRDGGGGEILVDRGFVSEKSMVVNGDDRKLKENDAIQPSGHVTLTALLPRISPPNYFTPENQPERNRWFHADPEAMAEYSSSGTTKALKLGDSESISSEQDTDSYTPSAGVGESVKKMLGLNSTEEHNVLPILVEEVFEGYDGNVRVEKGIPVGRAATIELRNQHAVYAATWFSLSAATAAMFAILVRRKR
ncbi:unnamed protein product [Sympodiomycopsis kandeliae]